MRLPPTFEARLIAARMLTMNVRELTFERTDQMPMTFTAGQWVNVLIPLVPEAPTASGLDPAPRELRRAYSIASAPAKSSEFQLAVTHVEGGPGSTFLHELPLGSVLTFVGPQGFFTRPLEKAGPSIFVATGTGFTPFRSMLHAALAEAHPMPMWLLFGVRNESDILYREELEGLAQTGGGLVRVEFTLSRAGANDGWAGRTGYVQTHLRELWIDLEKAGPSTPHVYVCGLAKMVSAVRELLRKEMGLPRELVHTERYD